MKVSSDPITTSSSDGIFDRRSPPRRHVSFGHCHDFWSPAATGYADPMIELELCAVSGRRSQRFSPENPSRPARRLRIQQSNELTNYKFIYKKFLKI
jgi:hypothetical protein